MTPAAARRLALSLAVVGWVFMATGFGLMVREMYSVGAVDPSRRVFLWSSIGLLLVGLWLVAPRKAEDLMAQVGTFIPLFKGRRSGDRDVSEQVTVVASQLPIDQQVQASADKITGTRSELTDVPPLAPTVLHDPLTNDRPPSEGSA